MPAAAPCAAAAAAAADFIMLEAQLGGAPTPKLAAALPAAQYAVAATLRWRGQQLVGLLETGAPYPAESHPGTGPGRLGQLPALAATPRLSGSGVTTQRGVFLVGPVALRWKRRAAWSGWRRGTWPRIPPACCCTRCPPRPTAPLPFSLALAPQHAEQESHVNRSCYRMWLGALHALVPSQVGPPKAIMYSCHAQRLRAPVHG